MNIPVWKCLIIIAITLTVAPSAKAQIIKGRITDTNGRPVHNASLFIRELRMGAAANNEGYFELRAPKGTYTCIFQCMGYETQTVVITIDEAETVTLNVELREMAFEIPEVVVSNNRGEDPAYAIMRRAIAVAPYYLHQVAEYKAEVYLKGTLHVGKISPLVRRMAGEGLEEMNIKEGNSYVEESINEIEFTVPNIYRQRVVKKTGSLSGDNSSADNAMTLITASIYDENAFNPVISPLSTSSFAHYRFRYEGFYVENERIINKIKIIPRRNSRQLFSGYVYIADGDWNVHSADVTGEFMMGVSYRMQMNFGEVNENVWMPVNYNFNFDASFLGNRGSFLYVASIKYTHLVENTSILANISTQQTRTSERIENLLETENLSNRQAYRLARLLQREAENEIRDGQSLDITASFTDDYKITVDSAATVVDTLFWEMMRPVPLNTEELRSYRERDIRLAAAPQKTDTVGGGDTNTPSPFASATKKIFLGTDIKLGEKAGTIRYHGINPSQMGFNTVDGFYVGQKLTYYTNLSKSTRLSVSPEIVWAINRKAVQWTVDAGLTYSPLRYRGRAGIHFGQKSTDLITNTYIHPLENTVSSLFFRRNYLKLYEDNFILAGNSIDVINGLQLQLYTKYSRRVILDNHSNYSFFFRDTRHYTSNVPVNAELNGALADNTSAIFLMNVYYTPRLYYRITSNNQKRYVKSDFPTFSATWRKGVSGIMGSNSNYDLIVLGIRQKIEPALMQEFRYILSAGAFVNKKQLFFQDFKHFNTVEMPFTIGSISSGSYNLLEYYRYSTSDKFLEAHLYYDTPFLLLKFLPWLSNRMLWSEGLKMSYLYSPNIKNYIEAGYTIGIKPLWEVGVFAGFDNFKYRSWGMKVAIAMGN